MKVLFVSPCCPWPLDTGLNQRLYHLLEALTRRHRVTLAMLSGSPGSADFPLREQCERVIEVIPTAGDRAHRERFSLWAPPADRVMTFLSSRFPNVVREYWSDALLGALRELKGEGQSFDAVWAERIDSAEVARQAGFRNIVVDLYDLETVQLRRTLARSPWYFSKPLHYAEAAKLQAYERSVPGRFGRVAVCKDEDRLFFPRKGRDVFVVPNGVPELPRADPAREQPGEVTFVGTLHYAPNVAAVQLFHDSILPLVKRARPDAHFHIVGRAPVPAVRQLHDGTSCSVHGDVPDVTPYFERASVVVAPIHLGSGTRLKVLEALARGKALVATSTAVEGLDLRPGVDFELAYDEAQFSAACVRLLESPAVRRQLGDEGRRRVLERYTWEAIGEVAHRVISGVAGSDPVLRPSDAAAAGDV
jgi:glycosyltransferase involved in cell wall biosynthesis